MAELDAETLTRRLLRAARRAARRSPTALREAVEAAGGEISRGERRQAVGAARAGSQARARELGLELDKSAAQGADRPGRRAPAAPAARAREAGARARARRTLSAAEVEELERLVRRAQGLDARRRAPRRRRAGGDPRARRAARPGRAAARPALPDRPPAARRIGVAEALAAGQPPARCGAAADAVPRGRALHRRRRQARRRLAPARAGGHGRPRAREPRRRGEPGRPRRGHAGGAGGARRRLGRRSREEPANVNGGRVGSGFGRGGRRVCTLTASTTGNVVLAPRGVRARSLGARNVGRARRRRCGAAGRARLLAGAGVLVQRAALDGLVDQPDQLLVLGVGGVVVAPSTAACRRRK